MNYHIQEDTTKIFKTDSNDQYKTGFIGFASQDALMSESVNINIDTDANQTALET
jgi:hypothetical protein